MATGVKIITTGTFPHGLKPIVTRAFGMDFTDVPQLYSQIFKTEGMTDKYNEYTSGAGLGVAQYTAEGQPFAMDTGVELFTTRLTASKYTLGFQMTEEAMDDEHLFKFWDRRTQELKRASIVAKEIAGHSVLNNAFDSNYTGGDGKELCSATHPTASAVLNNYYAADLSEAALEQMIINLMSWKDNRGILKQITANKLILPTALAFEYRRVLKNVDRPGTADRDINALNQAGILQNDPIISPYLTDTDAFFIQTSEQAGQDGLIYLDRKDDVIRMFNDQYTNNAICNLTTRFVFGWLEPRAIYGSPGV